MFNVYMRKNIDHFLIARFLFVFVSTHEKWLCFFVTTRFCIFLSFLHESRFCVDKTYFIINNNIRESPTNGIVACNTNPPSIIAHIIDCGLLSVCVIRSPLQTVFLFPDDILFRFFFACFILIGCSSLQSESRRDPLLLPLFHSFNSLYAVRNAFLFFC